MTLRASNNSRDQWFSDATSAQKYAAVHVLLAVATGDGNFAPEEKNAIAEACTRMGLSSLDVADALVRGMPADVDPPSTPEGRLQLLLDAAAVMVADRRIDDRELAVLLTVGQMLGFAPAEVADIAAQVVEAMRAQEQRAAVLRRLIQD